jgi:hypothetical protein
MKCCRFKVDCLNLFANRFIKKLTEPGTVRIWFMTMILFLLSIHNHDVMQVQTVHHFGNITHIIGIGS